MFEAGPLTLSWHTTSTGGSWPSYGSPLPPITKIRRRLSPLIETREPSEHKRPRISHTIEPVHGLPPQTGISITYTELHIKRPRVAKFGGV